MKEFLKYVLATIVGMLVIGLFSVVIIFGFVASIVASSNEKPSISEGSMLEISLDGSIVDHQNIDPVSRVFIGGEEGSDLTELLKAIKEAKRNSNIRAIFLNAGIVNTDLANLQELREALLDFKKSGKKIYAYGENYSQGAYYVASVADFIMLNPAGLLDWHGLSAQPVFYKDLLDKIGVKMQLIRVGKYKSFGESFTREGMSDENREQISTLINGMWKIILSDVSRSRRISVESLNAFADKYIAYADNRELLKTHLVDTLCYIDGAKMKLRSIMGGDKLNMVSSSDLVAASKEHSSDDGRIAVYYASGDIVDDRIPTGFSDASISASQMIPDLEKIAEDDDIKSVVIRINSPGGSASASEMIWHAIQKLNQRKPVIISMGGVAASGGYYIASAGRNIFADPTTITGSIGIFALIPDASNLLTQKIGLRFETVKTNASGDFLSTISRPLSSVEAGVLQNYVDRGYSLFLSRVSQGRHLPISKVNEIAQGRVWSGVDAKRIGLVDALGGLDNAIFYAAKVAKVSNYAIDEYPAVGPWYLRFLENAKSNYFNEQLQNTLGDLYGPVMYAKRLQGRSSVQTALPYELKVK